VISLYFKVLCMLTCVAVDFQGTCHHSVWCRPFVQGIIIVLIAVYARHAGFFPLLELSFVCFRCIWWRDHKTNEALYFVHSPLVRLEVVQICSCDLICECKATQADRP
jgi:hypothetical protein